MDTSTIEDFLECSICLEQLDERSKVLPCQHTFCMNCLNIIFESKGHLQCPECRSTFRDLSVSNLPRNVLLIRILEGLKTKRNSTGSKDLSPNQQDITRTASSEDLKNSRRLSAKVKCEALLNQPSARGLYDFISNEEGDLSFAKGDIITLVHVIDDNWLEGIVKGKRGSIPKNFVEILVSLPKVDDETNKIPFAKALFTFESKGEQELISFKEGDMIPVIKKVDNNWLEGVLGSQYGIFPVNFMKLNKAAQDIMSADCSGGSGSSCSSDDDNEAKQKIKTKRSMKVKKTVSSPTHRAIRRQQSQPQAEKNNKSPENLVTTSDHTKRHTIHLANPQEHKIQSRRALNLSDEMDPHHRDRTQSQGRRASESAVQQAANQERSLASTVLLERALKNSNDQLTCAIPPAMSPLSTTTGARPDTTLTFSTALSSGVPSPSSAASSPLGPGEAYTALFTYSPGQDDELALIQGDQYIVVEKHLDGWYKGIHSRSRQSGVFPGNYVKPSNQVTPQLLRNISSSPSRSFIGYGSNPSSPSAITSTANAFNFPPRGPETPNNASASTSPRRNGEGNCPSRGTGFGLLKILKKNKSKRSTPPAPETPTTTGQSPPSYYHSSMPAPAHHRLSRPSPVVPAEPPPPYTPNCEEDTMNPIINSSAPCAGEKFRVIIDYEGVESRELSLKTGDVIYVFRKSADGWFTGKSSRTGETGVFPSTFVEPLP